MCVAAIVQDLNAIDKNMNHAQRILMRILIGGYVCDGTWIKDGHVGEITRRKFAAPGDFQIIGGQRRHSSDRFLKRKYLFFPNVFSQYAGKRSKCPGMVSK